MARQLLAARDRSWDTDVVPAARATAVSLFVAALFVGGAVGTALVAPLADRRAFDVIFLIPMALAVPLTVAAASGYGDSRACARLGLTGAVREPAMPRDRGSGAGERHRRVR